MCEFWAKNICLWKKYIIKWHYYLETICKSIFKRLIGETFRILRNIFESFVHFIVLENSYLKKYAASGKHFPYCEAAFKIKWLLAAFTRADEQ